MNSPHTPVITFATIDKDGEDGTYRIGLRRSDNLDAPSDVEHAPDLPAAHKVVADNSAVYVKNMKMAAAAAPGLLDAVDDLRRAADAKDAAVANAKAAIEAALEVGFTEVAAAETLGVNRLTVRNWLGKMSG